MYYRLDVENVQYFAACFVCLIVMCWVINKFYGMVKYACLDKIIVDFLVEVIFNSVKC